MHIIELQIHAVYSCQSFQNYLDDLLLPLHESSMGIFLSNNSKRRSDCVKFGSAGSVVGLPA